MIRKTAAALAASCSISFLFYQYFQPSNSFEKIKITAISKESPNTLRLALSKRIESKAPFHIIIKDDSCEIGREYSPIEIEKQTFLIVKIYPHGTLSNLFSKLRVNDYISSSKPLSTFNLRDDDVALVAGGTGITPCFQILAHTLLNTNRNVTLFYINKTVDDILLKNELEGFVEMYPTRFKLNLAVDHEQGTFGISRGFEEFNLDPNNQVVVCGPEGFAEYVCNVKLKEIGAKEIIRLKS
jgi:NAD(P)H-flavin reductase